LGALLLSLLQGCSASPEIGDRTRAPTHRELSLAPTLLPGLKEEVLVGSLDVAEDPRVEGGRKIPLHVVVIPARRQDLHRPPLFFIEGGPGIAATNAAVIYLTDLSAFREERDVVLVDVRGTGASGGLQMSPKNESPLLAAMEELYPSEWITAGRIALERRADLKCYTTEQVVADLEAVRLALGYDQVDLHGLSYGTRVALGYMRRHPQHVHAAVLQGTAPPALHIPMYHASTAQHAMLGLFAECASDPKVFAKFGDLAEKLRTVMARLRATPAHVRFREPGSGAETEVVIRADMFGEWLRRMLYSRQSSQVVPLLVQRGFDGDFNTFLRLVAMFSGGGASRGPGLADGFNLCVTCAEDVPFIDAAEATRLAEGTFFGDSRVVQQRRACELWTRGTVPEDFFEPVAVDTPVLILCGGLDPVTPLSFSAEVARHLPNARVIVIPRMGHTEDGLSNIECFDRLLLDFLDRGSAAGLDMSCIETMLPGPVFTDESEMTFLGK
jgi:pimeloyl-ACP methyl ester carboxylesterase